MQLHQTFLDHDLFAIGKICLHTSCQKDQKFEANLWIFVVKRSLFVTFYYSTWQLAMV